jgi:SulP family sulfate permease
LGRVAGSDQFADIARHPENEQISGVRVLRVDDDIFYANTDAVKSVLLGSVTGADPPIRLVVLDLASTPFLDLAAIDMLIDTSEELKGQGAELWVAGATGDVRDALRRADAGEKLGPLAPGQTVESVIEDWQSSQGESPSESDEKSTGPSDQSQE